MSVQEDLLAAAVAAIDDQATARRFIKVFLSENERKELAKRFWLFSQEVCSRTEGLSTAAMARRTGASLETTRRIRRTFRQADPKGLFIALVEKISGPRPK